MHYYLVKLLTNAQGQDASSIVTYETKEAALKLIEILSFAKEHNSLVEFWF